MSGANKKDSSDDLCVSCVDCDREFVEGYFLNEIKKSGFSVWYADTTSKKNGNALAILRCKIFLPILSEQSAVSDVFANELSLAYVANKSIVPIARQNIRLINPLLNSAVKLMLAKINWTFFTKPEQFEQTLSKLIDAVRLEIEEGGMNQNKNEPSSEMQEDDVYGALNSHIPEVTQEEDEVRNDKKLQTIINCDFWERHFPETSEVLWTDFKASFLADYGERINRQLGGGKDVWLTLLIYKDIFELYKMISKQKYLHFCGSNFTANPDLFYDRVKSYATDILAMRNIFNMESSVRLVAIQNLGSFQTPSVIVLLFDLLDHSDDPNDRALAGLALAKTGKKSEHIQNRLMKLLKDEDRLVRESACLSLAHMKCTRAVPDILELWRNDAIKHVREAAELALSRMGGAEAEQAIHITQLLSKELKSLRESAPK